MENHNPESVLLKKGQTIGLMTMHSDVRGESSNTSGA